LLSWSDLNKRRNGPSEILASRDADRLRSRDTATARVQKKMAARLEIFNQGLLLSSDADRAAILAAQQAAAMAASLWTPEQAHAAACAAQQAYQAACEQAAAQQKL
jgi:hypothetical protein